MKFLLVVLALLVCAPVFADVVHVDTVRMLGDSYMGKTTSNIGWTTARGASISTSGTTVVADSCGRGAAVGIRCAGSVPDTFDIYRSLFCTDDSVGLTFCIPRSGYTRRLDSMTLGVHAYAGVCSSGCVSSLYAVFGKPGGTRPNATSSPTASYNDWHTASVSTYPTMWVDSSAFDSVLLPTSADTSLLLFTTSSAQELGYLARVLDTSLTRSYLFFTVLAPQDFTNDSVNVRVNGWYSSVNFFYTEKSGTQYDPFVALHWTEVGPTQTASITASDNYCDSVHVAWANVAGEDSFQVRRNGSRIGVTLADVLTYGDTTGAPGTSYSYSVSVCIVGDCGTPTVSASGGKCSTSQNQSQVILVVDD